MGEAEAGKEQRYDARAVDLASQLSVAPPLYVVHRLDLVTGLLFPGLRHVIGSLVGCRNLPARFGFFVIPVVGNCRRAELAHQGGRFLGASERHQQAELDIGAKPLQE